MFHGCGTTIFAVELIQRVVLINAALNGGTKEEETSAPLDHGKWAGIKN